MKRLVLFVHLAPYEFPCQLLPHTRYSMASFFGRLLVMESELTVVAEETVRSVQDYNNGAGPFWCYGSGTMIRDGDRVMCTVNDVVPESTPLCNTDWNLYCRRDGDTWRLVRSGGGTLEREPCPLVRLPDGRIVVSTNGSVETLDPYDDGRCPCRCEPYLLRLDVSDPGGRPVRIDPQWDGDYRFSEHSYRAIGADGLAGTLFLTQQVPGDGIYDQAWCFLNAEGEWTANGVLRFPMRGCYLTTVVKGRAVYIVAVSDETEPNEAWRDYKREVTGQVWDYDFRQLFYVYTPDIEEKPFSPVLTITSADETCGWTTHLGMAVLDDGTAYILYMQRNIQHPFMRDRFFPETPITVSLKLVTIRNGRVVARDTLMETVESEESTQTADGEVPMSGPVPDYGALHETSDGRLLAIWHQTDPEGRRSGNFIQQVVPWAEERCRIDLQTPLKRFFTATGHGGTLSSNTIDLLGTDGESPLVVRYAQVRISAR